MSTIAGRLRAVVDPFLALRRSGLLWLVSIAALVALTVAFWPAFQGASGISRAIDQLPASVVDAFGLAELGTPAGFLRGNLYDLIVPLLIGGATVGFANGLTAADEDAGRLELVLAQPVSRQGVFLARSLAATAWLVVLTAGTLAVQVASDRVVGLAIDDATVVATVVLCGLLGAFHGGLALLVAGLRPRPGLVLGLTLAVLIAGFVVTALFPLSDPLRDLVHLSPWDWAFGGDPLRSPTEPWRYLVLGLPAIAFTTVGAVAFSRRDVEVG
ncbi:MAG TPA: hypothetical protein VFS32_00140 [Candidatus Limnocylindrales bacterium]|nr:hypothetical protein [Candidatus Limnocylindrales bacterium]